MRDYLRMGDTAPSPDWRFVDFDEVPQGPWSTTGDNNTFVINCRRQVAHPANPALAADRSSPESIY